MVLINSFDCHSLFIVIFDGIGHFLGMGCGEFCVDDEDQSLTPCTLCGAMATNIRTEFNDRLWLYVVAQRKMASWPCTTVLFLESIMPRAYRSL